MRIPFWVLAFLLPNACAAGADSSLGAGTASLLKTKNTPSVHRTDSTTGVTYLSIPVRFGMPTSTVSTAAQFSLENWSTSLKQQGRVQVYIVATPDFYEVVEQELPRHQRDFNSLKEAIACANRLYADWPLVSMEPEGAR